MPEFSHPFGSENKQPERPQKPERHQQLEPPHSAPLSHLCQVIYPARGIGYLLAAMMLLQLEQGGWTLIASAAFMVLYPHLLQWMLIHLRASSDWAKRSMLIDAILVGLMVPLVNFNLEASAVLCSLLGISVLIVGGLRLFSASVPIFLLSALLGYGILPAGLVGGETFYLMSLLAILAYVGLVGVLVFRETHRLNDEHRQAHHMSRRLHEFRLTIAPFLPFPTTHQFDTGAPERKRLTVLFVDLEGFTDLMDNGDERFVAEMLNDYFTAVSQLTTKFGGTVDKFIGDGAMVYFGDPLSHGADGDALACVSMALALRDRFDALAAIWLEASASPRRLRIRIGIHTGYCLVGEFGCAQRKDYTALGSTVNRASRLEGQAGGDGILMSAETERMTRGYVISSDGGQVVLKGISEKMKVYYVDGLSRIRPETGPRLLG